MDELAPPKATITAIIKEKSGNLKFSNQYTEMVIEVSKKFISKLSAESNQICLKDGKKTIAPEHVFKAIKALKLDEYTKDLTEAHELYLKDVENKSKSKFKLDEEDEEKNKLLQEELFRTARNHSIEEMQKEGVPSQEPGLKDEQAKSNIIDLKPQFQQKQDDEDYEN